MMIPNKTPICYCALSGEANYGPIVCEICDVYDDELTEQLRENRMAWDHAVDALEEPYPEVAQNDFSVDIVDIVELPDGGANITVNLSPEALKHFAGVGILKVIEDAAWQAMEDHDLD